jgi:hypothetical protein
MGANNMSYDSTQDTADHIDKVRDRLREIMSNLTARAINHDASKTQDPEKPGYDILVGALAGNQYGTDAFKTAMQEANANPVVKAAIQHHYEANPHHPEHYEQSIAGMSLLDVIEMLADWKGASERHGPSALTLEYNIKRWNISPQLAAILENTVKELGW